MKQLLNTKNFLRMRLMPKRIIVINRLFKKEG